MNQQDFSHALRPKLIGNQSVNAQFWSACTSLSADYSGSSGQFTFLQTFLWQLFRFIGQSGRVSSVVIANGRRAPAASTTLLTNKLSQTLFTFFRNCLVITLPLMRCRICFFLSLYKPLLINCPLPVLLQFAPLHLFGIIDGKTVCLVFAFLDQPQLLRIRQAPLLNVEDT